MYTQCSSACLNIQVCLCVFMYVCVFVLLLTKHELLP